MPPYNNVGIFWDYENCAPSSNSSGFHLVERIRHLSRRFGSVNLFKAYLQFPEKSSPKLYSLRSDLQACGVSLTDCPHNGKNSVDLMMIVDIMAFVKDNPAPATIILISGDRDFAYMLSTIRWRQYCVVLISNTFMTHESLSAQANIAFDWQTDVLKTNPDSDASRTLRTRRDTSISNSSRKIESAQPTSDHEPSSQPLVGLNDKSSSLSFSLPPCATINNITAIDPAALLLSDKPPGNEEESITESSTSSPSTHSDDWTLTDGSPSPDQEPLRSDNAENELSPVFSSPELVPSDFEGDIPSSPGYLLLIGDSDDNLVPSPIEDLNNRNEQTAACRQDDSKSSEVQCDCKICIRCLSTTDYPRPSPDPVDDTNPASLSNSKPEPTHSPPQDSGITSSVLDVLAPTFAPGLTTIDTSVPQQQQSSSLIAVLNELRSNGVIKPRFSVVAPLLLAKKPDVYECAGVGQFKAYLQLAENIGIVSVEQDGKNGDGWISLHPLWQESVITKPHPTPASPPRIASSTKPPPLPAFSDLVALLNELRMDGDPEPRFSSVAPRLKRKDQAYELSGTNKFKDYIDAAVEAGIITVRGDRANGDGWVSLCARWHDQKPAPQPATPPQNVPPKFASTGTSPFQPLISVLEGLRSRGQEQPKIPAVFSSLVWSGQSNVYELAGVTTFKHYINRAVASGIIALQGDASNSEASISLVDRQKAAAPPIPQMSAFDDLIRVLEELGWTDLTEPRFSEVEPVILARNQHVYENAGVTSIRDYLRLAEGAGLVVTRTIAAGDEDGWVSLRSNTSLPGTSDRLLNTSSTGKDSTQSYTPVDDANIPAAFRDLVSILKQLRCTTGQSEARFASVVPLLLKKNTNAYPSVGVTKFKDYIELAVSAGVVDVRGMKNGDGWITLRESELGNNHSRSSLASESAPSSTPAIPPMFKDLVWLLRQLRSTGNAEPLFSLIASSLMRSEAVKARTLGAIGTANFKTYVEAARDASIVTMRYNRVGEERISLCPAWQAGGFVPVPFGL